MDKYVYWLEEKLMFALFPNHELAMNTKKAFRDILVNNFVNRDDMNYGDTYAIRRDFKEWYEGRKRK